MRSMTRWTSAATAAAIVAASTAVAAACLAWIFTRESSLGLYRWTEWRGRLNAIMIGAAAPAILGLAALALRRLTRGGPGALAAKAAAGLELGAAILGALVALGMAALWIGLGSLSRSMSGGPAPALRLVAPVSGIAPNPARGGSVLLSFSSDPHWGAETADARAREAVLRGVAAAKPDAFFALGDHVEQGMYEGPWREAAADYAAFLGEVPFRPIMGNHDGLINGQYHYERFFFPDRAASGSGSPFYYSIDSGPVAVFVLNLLWGNEGFAGKEARWLEEGLAALPPGKQAIVVSHCYAYASGYDDEKTGAPWYDHQGMIKALSPILERGKVALHISGHNHYLELLEKNGVHYAVVGALGGKLDPAPSYVSPASKWIAVATFGRLDVEASAAGLKLGFVDSEGKLLKEETIAATR